MQSVGGDLQSGGQAKDHTCERGCHEAEGQDSDVRADVGEKRDTYRLQTRQNVRSRGGQHHAQYRPTARERHAFGQHLADEASPSRPQRGADGNLLLPRRGPRQQQVGEIRTDNQHHHRDRACQHQQRRPDSAAHVFRQRRDSSFKIVALRVGARDLAGEDLQLGLGAADCDARFQPADDRHSVSPPVGFIAEGKRKIQVEMATGGEDRG